MCRALSNPIRAWTIQPAAWWTRLQSRGEIRGDGRRTPRSFRPAYHWLMQQMSARLPDYSGGFPVWLWYLPKPDLRRGAHLPRNQPGVRVEFLLPAERVLLLDFETWHCVLNRWHLPLSENDSEEWDRRTQQRYPYSPSLPEPLESELQATWERVFDLDWLRQSACWGGLDRIQAVTAYVRLDEVTRVDKFVAR